MDSVLRPHNGRMQSRMLESRVHRLSSFCITGGRNYLTVSICIDVTVFCNTCLYAVFRNEKQRDHSAVTLYDMKLQRFDSIHPKVSDKVLETARLCADQYISSIPNCSFPKHLKAKIIINKETLNPFCKLS